MSANKEKLATYLVKLLEQLRHFSHIKEIDVQNMDDITRVIFRDVLTRMHGLAMRESAPLKHAAALMDEKVVPAEFAKHAHEAIEAAAEGNPFIPHQSTNQCGTWKMSPSYKISAANWKSLAIKHPKWVGISYRAPSEKVLPDEVLQEFMQSATEAQAQLTFTRKKVKSEKQS